MRQYEVINFLAIYVHSAEVLSRLCSEYFARSLLYPALRRFKKAYLQHMSTQVMSAHGARTCTVRAVYFACTHNVRSADIKSAF